MNPQNSKKKIIGVLGGMGPESTMIFYHALIRQCQKQYGAKYDEDYPEIFIYNLPIPNIVEGLGQAEKTLTILIKGAKKIESIGVDFMVMPCNTTHYFYSSIAKSISIPFLHIFHATSKKVKDHGFKKVGLLATEMTIKHKSFGKSFGKNGIELIFPDKTDQDKLTRIILNILAGKKRDKDKKELKQIIDRMKQDGAKAVVLACTDLPILLKQEDVDIPIFDTVEILAETAIQYAIGKPDL
ncbi:amino acid racemase [Candidatus Peregrinibacteria bacterium]|nr:MAG: amino acid racemase [Candidatus Peregrinibacteria bacterium]